MTLPPPIPMRRHAFTAIEMLLAIGLISATAGIAVPVIRNIQIRNDLNVTTTYVVQALHVAQSNARSGKNSGAWGVALSEGVLFEGAAYAERVTGSDEAYPLSTSVSFSGLGEVVFLPVTGKPGTSGEVILTALNGDQRIITIDGQGTIAATGIADALSAGSGGDDEGGATGGSGTNGQSGIGGTGDSSNADTSSAGGGTDGGTQGGDSGGSGGETGTTGGTTGGAGGDGGTTGTTGTTGGTGGEGTTGGTGGTGEASSAAQSSAASTETSSGASSQGDGTPGGGTRCEDRFLVASDGSLQTTGRVSATVKALGSQITYGAGGPDIDVHVEWSTDGRTWTSLFGGFAIHGDETETIANLTAGTKLQFRVNGSYANFFRRSFTTTDGTGHIEVLRDGDLPPSYPAFRNQANLQTFLRGVLNTAGRIHVGTYDVILLAELGDLGTSSADFQDGVILVTFTQQAGSCTGASSSVTSAAGTGTSSQGSAASASSTGTSSSDNGEKITICHLERSDQGHTIIVSENAWLAHQGHGDHKGQCDKDDDGDEITNAQDMCPGTRVDNPRQYLLFFRYGLTDSDSDIFRVGPQRKVGEFTLGHTMGCSCEQLLDAAQGKGENYLTTLPRLYLQLRSFLDFYISTSRKFGCGRDLFRLMEKNKK